MTKRTISSLLLLMLCSIIISCSANKNIAGNYYQKYFSFYRLKSDYTFTYQYLPVHMYRYSEGVWKIVDKNKIVLDSKIKNLDLPYKVIEKKTDGNTITIDLKIENGWPLKYYRCNIFVNNKPYRNIRCDSVSDIPIYAPIKSILLKILKPREGFGNFSNELETKTYLPVIKNGAAFSFKIQFNDEYFSYEPINRDTIIVNKNNLERFDPGLKQWVILIKATAKEARKKHLL